MGNDDRQRGKKLVGAGRRWIEAALKKSKGDDELADDIERHYGADAAAAYRAAAPSRDYIVDPANAAAVRALLAVQTQFGENGFDYAAVRAGWRLAGIEITPDLFRRFQRIESGAMQALAEYREEVRRRN